MTVRVFNLTDVQTPALHARGLVNVSLTVGGKTVAAGKDDEVVKLTAVEYKLVASGALAINELPAAYVKAKAAQPAPEPPAPPPAPGPPALPPSGIIGVSPTTPPVVEDEPEEDEEDLEGDEDEEG